MTMLAHLSTLENGGLIRLAQTQPELEYLFRHALIQDAAYASLVKHSRRQLHQTVAETLEQLFPNRRDELAPLLAHHFDAAGDANRALAYTTQAGDLAAQRYANAEAVLYYSRALAIADRVHPQPALQVYTHLYSASGHALRLNSRYDEALANYVAMEELGRRLGEPALELAGLIERATIHATTTPRQDVHLARQLLARALELARRLNDRAAEAKINWNLMLTHLFGFEDDASLSVTYGERALAQARELDLREQMAFTLNDLGNAYMFAGRLDRALAAAREAGDLWRALGNLPMLADSLSILCRLQAYAGEFELAVEAGRASLDIARRIGNLWGQAHSLGMLGYPLFETGRTGEALEAWTTCLQLARVSGLMAALVGIQADLAWAYDHLGATDRALEASQRALRQAETAIAHWRPWAAAVLARLHLRQGRVAEADALLRESRPRSPIDYFGRLLWFGATGAVLAHAGLALAHGDAAGALAALGEAESYLRAAGARMFLPDVLGMKGRALVEQGRLDEARETLAEARATAEAIGSRRSLWSLLLMLSDLETRRGIIPEAAALRRQAREMIDFMADHCPPDLRASFLSLPDVRRMIA
jgi:tetratricopeptide (TPR) repeat protein